MKKLNFKKVTLLFLLILCLLSSGIILLRNFYYARVEKLLEDEVCRKLEEELKKQEDLEHKEIEEQEERNFLKRKTELNVNHEEGNNFKDGMIGIIIIPTLEIKAPVFEGVSQEVLKRYVRAF